MGVAKARWCHGPEFEGGMMRTFRSELKQIRRRVDLYFSSPVFLLVLILAFMLF